MCGIFGIISQLVPPSKRELETSCELLAHRGPDGYGYFIKGPVGFAHRRLSIIDIAQGSQPMSTQEGELTITYNGEIYNFRHIKASLVAKGYSFQTNSDTEVILAAYKEWGTECVQHLRGMFAFAIADHIRQTVFLARDPFGIKPLVYRESSLGFAFSSELPALVRLKKWPSVTVSPKAVSLFFRHQYIPAPYTIYNETQKLPPAHAMLVDFNGCIQQKWRYWTPAFHPSVTYSLQDAIKDAHNSVTESIDAHTLSDVPIGVFLSGGIDSTLVAARLAQRHSRSIPAFTIGYKESDFSELPYAQHAADKLGLKLYAQTLDEKALKFAPEILSHYGEPFGDSSVIPTWHVCKLASEHVPVCLSGDGADELFGGYQKYQIWSESTPWRQLQLAGSAIAKRKLRTAWWMLRRASRSFCDDKAFWLDHVQYYPPQGIRQLTHPDMHPYANAFAPAFDEPFLNIDKLGRFEYAQRMDLLSYLPDCLLAKVDLASMAHGLEVRPALLDKYVFQLAATLPTDVKLHPQKGGKVVLKELLLRQGFSEEFVYRPKQGFALPLRHWFISGQPANNMLCELVSSYKRELSEHLTVSDIERMLTAHSPACDYSGPLWLAFAFTCWVANTSK